ncbi:SRPBCC family protein [Marinivivus vitaminiproducens]|uniref:SRPBCC family protein n=1 Tax=Marinivivus vitaminiproducens TaxID=3035935 RepID=UPI00279C048A|nr:SRPBCC family protein [Geminicoccaceae bacterium SCSIO 64248]
MTKGHVEHGTIVLERRIKAPPARVFTAWASEKARVVWAAPKAEWVIAYDRFDFRVGGHEVGRFGPPEGPHHVTTAHYYDIVPERRIVFAYGMAYEGATIAVALTTVDLQPDGGGTRLLLTEQLAALDGGDRPEYREAGWSEMLDKLVDTAETA